MHRTSYVFTGISFRYGLEGEGTEYEQHLPICNRPHKPGFKALISHSNAKPMASAHATAGLKFGSYHGTENSTAPTTGSINKASWE